MRMTFVLVCFATCVGLIADVTAQDAPVAATKVCVLDVSDMACSSCAAAVQKAAMKVAGVTAAKVSQPTNSAEITFDPVKTTPELIAKAITKKTGFPAKPRVGSQ